MSKILGSITGTLGRLFKNLLPNWGDPTPPKLPEPSELPVPEEEPGLEEEGKSDYETALTYQNTETRWYSAIQRFLFWKKQGNNIEFYDKNWFVIKANLNETLQEAYKRYNEEAEAILCIYWPIGAGEFRTFSHINTDPISYNLKYRIYHANIEGHLVNHKCTRTFRYNPAEYYTHYDLQLAIDLGLHIELSSESPNALIFGQNQLMSGHDIFYQWASYLTIIKNEGGQAGKVAKHMLVSLWGRLYSDERRPGPHQ
ncbi:5463_t:CDS:2, partial [Racocetra fulgida]